MADYKIDDEVASGVSSAAGGINLPQVHIYAAVSCHHTADSMFNQSITCNYQYIVLGNKIMLFHVIYFKHGLSRQLLKPTAATGGGSCAAGNNNNNNVQYRLNMKGEVERIYECLPGPVLCSAAQLQPASSMVIGVLIDAMLLQNLKLLYANCTHAMLNKSPKLYLENCVHVNGTSATFLFNNMVKVERNFNVCLKVFLKNIHAMLKQFLFTKKNKNGKSGGGGGGGSSSSGGGGSGGGGIGRVGGGGGVVVGLQNITGTGATDCVNSMYPCKFKQMRAKFESFDYTNVHAALCACENTILSKFNNLEYLLLTHETITLFEQMRNGLSVM